MSVRAIAPRTNAAPRSSVRDRTPDGSRASELAVLHQRFGNRAIGRLLQTKLRVGAPNDRYEREADHVADLVMRTTDPVAEEFHPVAGHSLVQPCSCGGSCASCSAHKLDDEDLLAQREAISDAPVTFVQRDATDSCEIGDEPPEPEEKAEEEDETKALEEGEKQEEEAAAADASESGSDATPTNVQPKRSANAQPSIANVESRIEATRERGTSLPRDTRRFMESRFGHDFSSVRVHTDGESHRLNRDLNSLAFTTGRDIYFAPGQFQPATAAGQHLLAHELTHVVQQAGGRGGVVREKADPNTVSRAGPERKWYYYKIHKETGKSIHGLIESLLLAENHTLLTEAAIPGANRFSPALNKIGTADLYTSDPPRTVTGVKGFRDLQTVDDVVAMNNPAAVKTRPLDQVKSEPTFKRSGRKMGWSGNFPSKVWVGEIKPLSASKVAEGIHQLNSYKLGYEAFVPRVSKINGGRTRASIDVERLSITIPAYLDWDQWTTQHAVESPRSTQATRRFWIASLGGGIYTYFDLASGLRGDQPAGYAEDVRRMREIRQSLGQEKQRTDKLEPLASGKFLPGPRNIRPASRTHIVQRSTKDRPANYWSDRGTEWEKERSTWAKGFRKTLKNQYRQYRDKVRVEKKLGLSGRGTTAPERAEVKEYNQLMFWSGLPGRFLGKVRFLIGSVWDKIIAVFENFKEKMHGLRTKVNATSGETMVSIGWQKKLLKVLVRVAKVVAVKFLTESFNFFVDCFHSAMDKVFANLQAEFTEKLAMELCRARKLFDASKQRLEDQWGISFGKLAELVSTIQDAVHWVGIASDLITLIRIGIEAISCLTPPLLGCLWGLVAQIGIGTGLDLLIGTRWFDDNIVTPTIRDLVHDYATPLYQKLINKALGEDLKEYHCHIAEDAFPKLVEPELTGTDDPAELRRRRDLWETVNQDAMLKDLVKVFQAPPGQGYDVTKEQLLALAERIKQSGKTPAEIKAMLLAARNPTTGKLEIQKAQANVEAGKAPAATAKTRAIDYPKATKANPLYQKQLGWDSLTFYAKPGVAVDSEEFADAVYDLQESIHIHADGILGEDTVRAFYDKNKLKHDAAYEAAKREQERRKAAADTAAREKAAKEKAARLAAERTKAEAASKARGSAGSEIAIPIPTAPPSSMWITGSDMSISQVLGFPWATVKPTLTGKETPGSMLSIDLAYWFDQKWVWFTAIPVTFLSLGMFNDNRLLAVRQTEEFLFRLASRPQTTFAMEKGDHGSLLLDSR